MSQKQPFLPNFKQRGFVYKYKLIAVHQRYEAAAISIRKGLFKCTLVYFILYLFDFDKAKYKVFYFKILGKIRKLV